MVVLAAGLIGVVWMFTGRMAGEAVTANAQVVGAIASVVAAALATGALAAGAVRLRVTRCAAAEPLSMEQAKAAVEYVANETLRSWRKQAKHRQIRTPCRYRGPKTRIRD